MAQPPPPHEQAGAPAAPAPRPASLTAAAIVLIVLGVLYALFGVAMIIGGGAATDLLGGRLGGTVIAIGAVIVAFGVLDVISGVRVLGLSPGWRIGGIVLASLGALFALISVIGAFQTQQFDVQTGQLTQGGVNVGGLLLSLVLLAANVFVVVEFARQGRVFRR